MTVTTNTTTTRTTPPPPSRSFGNETQSQAAAGGFGVSALVGVGVAVLTLIAIGGIWPRIFVAIAVIAVGALLLIESLGVAARYRKSFDTEGAGAAKAVGLSAVSVELVGGGAAIVLGILALVGVLPMTLLDIACIAFGGAMALGSGAALRFGRAADFEVENTVSAYAAARPIAGMGAAILGIIGLMNLGHAHQGLFIEISLLAVGAAAFLGGFALAGGHAQTARLHTQLH